jgi:uncharacterized protein (DUF427 family)
MSTSTSSKPKLNVQSFPRPPLLEKTPRHLRVVWNDREVLSTDSAFWVLETHHPPTYYIPQNALSPSFALHKIPGRQSYCEWKGVATYWTLKDEEKGEEVKGKIWSYEDPTKPFSEIKGCLSFYASGVPWKCFVDGEEVEPQPGDFYGGWKTSDIVGTAKGGPGTWGW